MYGIIRAVVKELPAMARLVASEARGAAYHTKVEISSENVLSALKKVNAAEEKFITDGINQAYGKYTLNSHIVEVDFLEDTAYISGDHTALDTILGKVAELSEF